MDNTQELQRWRLILGQESENRLSSMNMPVLSEEQDLMDRALASIYSKSENGGFGGAGNGGGHGPSNPQISRWLGDVRTLFDKEIVKIIQSDAVNRCGLKQLLFEPELLENTEPDVNLASTILTLKDMIPKRSKDSVRAFIKKIVEDINKQLEQDIRRAVTAAVNKRAQPEALVAGAWNDRPRALLLLRPRLQNRRQQVDGHSRYRPERLYGRKRDILFRCELYSRKYELA